MNLPDFRRSMLADFAKKIQLQWLSIHCFARHDPSSIRHSVAAYLKAERIGADKS
jgi:hypothetical protein